MVRSIPAVIVTAIACAASAAAAEPLVGVSTDVGVPDGAMASLVVRPSTYVKMHAGAGYNFISSGYRAGVTLTPLPLWVTPTASLSYGRYQEGDANKLARMLGGDSQHASLQRVGYQFVDAYLGLQFGRRRAQLQIEAGYSRVVGAVHDLDATAVSNLDSNTSFMFTSDPVVTVWSLSARIGLTVYIK